MSFVVGTWSFPDPEVPLDTPLYELRLEGEPGVRPLSAGAAAVYYGTVEPGGDSLLLLHNDGDRSAMSRQRLQPDGSVVEEGRWSSGGPGGSFIAFDRTGTYFVVTNSHAGWAVFRDGTEPELIADLRNEGSGPHPRQVRSHPHCGLFTPDNRWIYAADMGSDEVLAWTFDATTGQVGEKVRAHHGVAGAGPRHVHARGDLIYVLNELNSTLVVAARETDGTLTERQALSTLPSGYEGPNETAHIEISADGRTLYVTNRGHDSLGIFDVAPDGSVQVRDWVPSGGKWPWFFLLADDRMLVANTLSDVITVFDVDADGDLHPATEIPVRRPIFFAKGT